MIVIKHGDAQIGVSLKDRNVNNMHRFVVTCVEFLHMFVDLN